VNSTLNHLSPGTYYWSVQAIDHGYAGSPFAVEASFIISEPTLSDIARQFIRPNSSTGPLPFTVTAPGTSPDTVILTTTSSEPAVIPLANIALGGSGTNRPSRFRRPRVNGAA
jgi:hypothetical protein